MEKFFSTCKQPLAIVGEGTDFIADIGQVYVHVQYGATPTAEEKNSGYREMKRWFFQRTELDKFIIRQLFMRWSRDTGGTGDVMLLGSHSGSFKKTFEEEFSKSVSIVDKLDCLTKTFIGHLRHSSVPDVLYEESERGIAYGLEAMGDVKSFIEGVDMKFEKGMDFSKPLPDRRKSLPANFHLPCLFVYVGSSTMFVKVDEDGTYQVIDTDPLGEALYNGLGSHTTDERDFEKFLDMAENADGRTVNQCGIDLKDPDSDGDAYSKFGDNMIVFPFGKAYLSDKDAVKVEDVSMSMMFVISNTLSKLGPGIAVAFQLKHVYFGGRLIDHDEFRARMTSLMFLQNTIAPEPLRVGYNFLKGCGFYGATGGLKAS